MIKEIIETREKLPSNIRSLQQIVNYVYQIGSPYATWDAFERIDFEEVIK